MKFISEILCISLLLLVNTFSPECNGKPVTCEQYGIGGCTAMYCPPTITYDKDGRVISTTKDCNTCTYTQRCWCDGHSFTITK